MLECSLLCSRLSSYDSGQKVKVKHCGLFPKDWDFFFSAWMNSKKKERKEKENVVNVTFQRRGQRFTEDEDCSE